MDWHRRFVQQAAWTSELRSYLFRQAEAGSSARILEVGCGTGATLSVLTTPAILYGLDLDAARLKLARRHAPQAILTCGNALRLPYATGSFDITFCHFLLLWVGEPLQALLEMKRVTRIGGSILAMAEPDYTGRVDKPEALAVLGRLQAEALRAQGADPSLGRRLAGLFQQAGLQIIQAGALQSDEKHTPSPEEWALEWEVLEDDLAGCLPVEEMQRLKRLDENAWQRGERRLYVPTYFAWGRTMQMV